MLSRISSGERPSGTPSKLREISRKLTGSWSRSQVHTPTLLIIGGNDELVTEMNMDAL
jgi:hypothetical protein